jgi:hypothetical protein
LPDSSRFFQKHDAASVDIMRWVWVATREFLLPHFDGSTFGNVFLAKISSVPKIVRFVHARRPTA